MPYYGTNGFYLPFSDNSTTTALGYDLSGDSTARYNATVAGNAQISTAQSKFGGSSAYFDGTGDYLTLNGSSDFAFGTGDFTIEMWVYFSAASTDTIILYESRSGAASNSPIIAIGNIDKAVTFTDGSSNLIVGQAVTTGQWYHIAVCRASSSTRLFVNGTQSGSTISDTRNYVVAANRPAISAQAALNGGYLNGYIDDLRVYKGYAKYTTNFTAPSAALPIGASDPYWRYCSLAMPMDGTNASTTFPVYRPNSWTPTNFSVTAGTGNDSLIDTPTPYADGSTNRGNYCTWNPLTPLDSGATLSNGNLVFTSSATRLNANATMMIPAGKFYAEITLGTAVSSNTTIAFSPDPWVSNQTAGYRGDGQFSNALAGTTTAYGTAMSNGDIIGIAIDRDSNTLEFFRNGVSQGIRTGIAFPQPVGLWITTGGAGQIFTLNAGQRPFQYTPPTGFKALNTYNLP